MAVSVDTVYQRVLALANKEQRGYITPQQFNLLANQAQMSIFESYFYHKNAREVADANKSNEIDETNISELLDRKLAPFSEFLPVVNGHTFPETVLVGDSNRDIFQTGVVLLGDEPCQKVSMHDAQRLRKSLRHMATVDNQAPFYTNNRITGRDIVVYAGGTDSDHTAEETTDITVECFRVPLDVNWAYVVVNSKALYNSYASTDFELHVSEEDTLVYKILELAGIVMNKTALTTTIAQYNQGEQQLQNQ